MIRKRKVWKSMNVNKDEEDEERTEEEMKEEDAEICKDDVQGIPK